MRLSISSLIAAIFLFCNIARSQVCTTLGQNPSTAFPVCGATTFFQSTVPLCGGQIVPGPCGTAPPLRDVNPFWYKFTCYTTGTLGFLITPINNNDDYDWQLFDITGHNPNDVYTDASLFVACNWSGFAGPTGAVPGATGLIHCAGNVPNMSAMPTLVAGHEYILLVSNFSSSQQGYTLVFTGGTADITDPNIPAIVSATPNCDGSIIGIKLNKPVFCNSLTATGSDFIISPSGAIATATGVGCTAGFTMDSITLTLSSSLAPGNYTLAAATGSDGNTLLDNCGLAIAVGNNVSFTIQPRMPLPMGITGTVSCAPVSITLDFADTILCNTIAPNGTDFIITGPSPVSVISATASCNANGGTNSITVQFASPITVSGNYQLEITTGSDGNTLLGLCSRVVPVGSAAAFTVQPQPPIQMGTIVPPGCSPDSITLNFTDPILCNTVATDGSDFSISGAAPVTIIGATFACSGSGETNTIVIHFSNPINVSGNYQLQVTTGSDGNTLIGQCLRVVTSGSTAAFTIPVVPSSAMTAIATPGCSPVAITFGLDEPVKCTSIAADGSDFNVTGPSAVTVSAASGANCINGLADSITVQFASPILTGGNYQLLLIDGNDGNTLLNDCNRSTLPSSIFFTASDTVSAAFTYQVQSDCITDEVSFFHPGGNNINSWSWFANGSSASNQASFIQTFPATSQNTVELTVSNGVCADTESKAVDLMDRVSVDFDVPDFICPEDTVVFHNLSSGFVDNWLWDFNNGLTSSLQHPPAQRYPITGVESFYNITLTATNNNSGCQDSKTKTLKILNTCLIAVPTAFTPNNDGLNDFLYPLNGFNADNLVFKVYNRWGQLLFATKDWLRKWDGTYKGTPQSTGVFAWTLSYTDRSSGKSYSLKGTSLLIR